MSRRSITLALAAALAMLGCAGADMPASETAAQAKAERPSRFQPMPMITYYQPEPYGPLGPQVPAAVEQERVDLGAK